jgi:hypothetical protein
VLTREKEALSETIDIQSSKIAAISAELERLRLDPPPDGRLETAWAAIDYLGAKAGDAISRLENGLREKARGLEEAHRDILANRERVKSLEGRLDTLSLLYWTMISLSAQGQGLDLPDGSDGGTDDGSDPSSDPESGDEGQDPESSPAAGKVKGALLSGALLKGMRKAARRSLFSLFLTGGLVFMQPGQSQAGSAASLASARLEAVKAVSGYSPGLAAQAWEKGGALAPLTALAVLPAPRAILAPPAASGDRLDPGPAALPAVIPDRQSRPSVHPPSSFSQLQGQPAWAPPFNPAPAPDRLSSRMHSPYLGRILDLGFLEPGEWGQGPERSEAKARDILAGQARSWGVGLDLWRGLVRAAYQPGQPVYLPDLGQPAAPVLLLRPRLPKLAKALTRLGFLPSAKGMAPILEAVSDMKAAEGLFWDRIFSDFREILGNSEEACRAVLFHLAKRGRCFLEPRPEFGGQLCPFKPLEILSEEEKAKFLAGHIRTAWRWEKASKPVPRGLAPDRLSGDLVAASRISGLPLTFLAAMAHQHFLGGGRWPRAMDLYAQILELKDLCLRLYRYPCPGRPPLLDLDDLAGLFKISRANPNVFAQCKSDLVNSYRQTYLPSGLKLFS